jgi:cupin fold WbuC family metalloprotein
VLRGSLKVIFFNDKKEMVESFILNPKTNDYGIHISKAQWHTLEVLESGTVIFEVKDGPYMPIAEEDML